MKTLRQEQVRVEFVELMPDTMEQGVLYYSEEYNGVNHLCLCGCGGRSYLPINSEALPNHGWDIDFTTKGKVTLKPSILNSGMACKSHYIITNSVANFV
jgi:hypothetical protein